MTAKAARDLAHNRLKWVVVASVSLWVVLIGRLVQVQAVEHDQYAQRAREQYERRVELKADRGSIFDRRGRELAVDVRAVSFAADPKLVDAIDEVAEHFGSHGSQNARALARQLKTGKRFVYLARQLTGERLEAARARAYHGVSEFAETKRHYPYGGLAGQVLGHTNIDNTGMEGVERAADQLLRETNGSAVSRVDARGFEVPGSQRQYKTPRHGGSLVLTIDAVYQDILEEELLRTQAQTGAASAIGIISRPNTGEILALANVSLYDPNLTAKSPPQLRRNRAITDPFEPGSTFKAITAAAVLEDALALEEERVFCENGELALDHGETIRDAHPYGWLTFVQVMEKSSNIGIIKLAQRMERERFYEYIRNFGFGIRTGIGLPAESAGLLNRVGNWSERSLETIAIGQEVSVTALQLVQAYGAIANGGTLMAPAIVKRTLNAEGGLLEETQPQSIRRVVSESSAAVIRRMLAGAVRSGTGRRARIEGVDVAGKTGTAQKVASDGQGYDPDAAVASFVGFLPAAAPRLLCLIVVDNPQGEKWGGHVAAPTFRRVMERILYLGDEAVAFGSGDFAVEAQRPRMMQPVRPRLPDLRGMTQPVADFQARLRGMAVEFEGRGDVVVAQKPLPGPMAFQARSISCVLGSKGKVVSLKGDVLPLRQALLLRNL